MVNVTLPPGMDSLPTAGGTSVTLTGEYFGDRSRFHNGTAVVTYGPDDGYGYVAKHCNMTIDNTEVVCESVPGIGRRHHWRITHLGNISAASPGTTRYTEPNITEIDPEYEYQVAQSDGRGGFRTQGGQNIVLRGSNFGPLNSTVTAYYQNNVNTSMAAFESTNDDTFFLDPKVSSLGSARFHAVNCSVVIAHTEVNCTTVPGVGRDQYWVLRVGEQENLPATSPTTRYLPPVIERLDLLGDAKFYPDPGRFLLETYGGDEVWINGSNLGPDLPVNPLVVTYQNKDLSNLAGSVFSAIQCQMVVPHESLRCVTVPGVGFNHTWRVKVGGQWSNQTEEFFTSYKRPVLGPLDNATAFLFDAMGTPGGDVLVLNGTNFGPNVSSNVIQVTFHNKELTDLAGAVYEAVSCSMVAAHTMLLCFTPPGVGYNFTWTVTMGHQTQDLVRSHPIRSSYHRPMIKRWADPHLENSLRTSGGEFVYIDGFNLGPQRSDNVVSATFENTDFGGLAGTVFQGLSCLVVIPHEQIRCTTPEGVGMNHTWGIIIGQQANVGNANPGDANIACPNQGCTEEVTLLSSYIPPVVSSVTAVTTTGLMDTAGGDEILIIGTNFGPNSALPLNMINVTYSNPYLSDLQQPGVELEGVVYRPVGCEVINHELATCRSVAGIGSQFLWTIWIGGQVWPSRNGYWYDSSLLYREYDDDDDFVVGATNSTNGTSVAVGEEKRNEKNKREQEGLAEITDAQKTSYKPPNIAYLVGPNGQTNNNTRLNETDILLNASGGEVVVS